MGGLLQTALHLYPVERYLVYKIRPFSAIHLSYASRMRSLTLRFTKMRIMKVYINLKEKLYIMMKRYYNLFVTELKDNVNENFTE